MTLARHLLDSADVAAATLVHHYLATREMITVEYDPNLAAPYAADEHDRRAILPPGLPWYVEHARLNRVWLFMTGGVDLAPEFAETEPMPGRGCTPYLAPVIPLLRRRW